MYQQSIYTHIFKRDTNYYLYNSKSALFAQISQDLYEVLYNRSYNELPEDILSSLIQQNVIVNSDEQYLHYYECMVRANSRSYNDSVLGLVIAPTTGCNFNCPYCFEGEKNVINMTDKVENGIIDFIKKHENAKEIHLTWYGGEPLTAFNRIRSLYDKISSLNLKITNHQIITNGYNLTPEIISFLKNAKLQGMQITLDGTEATHNKTRCLKGSHKPTFQRIIENIKLLRHQAPEIHLSIRVNINRDNAYEFIEVYHYINDMLHDPTINIYPGLIREETTDGCDLCYSSLNNNDYFKLLKQCAEKNIPVNFMPRHSSSKNCMINNLNAFIIGPEGELYKCWNDFNHRERIIGNILDTEFSNRKLFLQYMTQADIHTEPKCKSCLTFPTCSGGCGFHRLKNKFSGGRYNLCPVYHNKNILEEALLLTLKKKNAPNDSPILNI